MTHYRPCTFPHDRRRLLCLAFCTLFCPPARHKSRSFRAKAAIEMMVEVHRARLGGNHLLRLPQLITSDQLALLRGDERRDPKYLAF